MKSINDMINIGIALNVKIVVRRTVARAATYAIKSTQRRKDVVNNVNGEKRRGYRIAEWK